MPAAVNAFSESFGALTGVWFANLLMPGLWLLVALTTISLAVELFRIILQGGRVEIGDVLVALVQKVLVFGFWFAVIANAMPWTRAILDGLVMAASVATGNTVALDPGGVLEAGVNLAGRVLDEADWGAAVFAAIAALFIVAFYAAICALVVQTYAEFYIVTAAGSLFLGLGGADWTSEPAKRYLWHSLGIAARLYGLFLVVGFGTQMVDAWVLSQGEIDSTVKVLTLFGAVFIVFLIAMMTPASLQQLVGGGSVSAMGPLALMQGTMSAAGGLGSAAIRGGAAVQAAGGLSAAQMGAGSVGGAVRAAMAGAAPKPGSLSPSAGGRAAAGVGAAGEVAGRTVKNLAAGLFGTVKGQALGQNSTAGNIQAMREMIQGFPMGSGEGAAGSGVEGSIGPGGDAPPDRKTRYLGQRD